MKREKFNVAYLKCQFIIDNYYQFRMNVTNSDKRITYARQRNQKISSVLVLLITIYQKVQKLKQKLCGFSPTQFSPESIFQALDLTSKGYLDTYDIHSFLGNDTIRDKDILILFSRLGDQGLGRLTYLGYLALLKPFFHQELARDLLLRDTVTHRRKRVEQDEKNLHEMQETVLILLNELILLHCICIAEHETMKTALSQECMLNQLEIKQILGLGGKIGALTAIHQFIECNSDYDVEKSEVKYLLSFIQSNQISLAQEKSLNLLFMPARSVQKKIKQQTQGQLKSYEKSSLHANYTKHFLGKGDLIVTSNKLSFLNYIHPSSFQKPVNDALVFTRTQQRQYIKEEQMEQEHKKLSVSRQKLVYQAFKPPQKQTLPQRQKNEQIRYIKRPDSQRLQQFQEYRIDTPVLEQFMHESNIRRNMGNYKAKKETKLKVLIEESNISDSDGIVRVDYTSKEGKNKIEHSNYYQPKRMEQDQGANRLRAEVMGNKSNQYSRASFNQNRSDISNPGGASGILNQFLKSEFR